MQSLLEPLNHVPLAGAMLIVALGFLAGRLSWHGLSPGAAGGTLLVALVFGHFGFDAATLGGAEVSVGDLGFALFIYSVGFEAGPGFFQAFRGPRGWRIVFLAVLVNVLAIAAAITAATVLTLDPSAAAGVLAGSLTSAPTFAAVSEVCDDTTALSLAFALTYPFGLVGVVLAVQVLPQLLGQDLAGEADRAWRRSAPRLRGEPETLRTFRATREAACGRTLRELSLPARTGCFVARIRRGGELLTPRPETPLERGDHILAGGRVDELHRLEEAVGPEVWDPELRSQGPAPRRVLVLSRRGAGKSLRELALTSRYRCMVSAIERGGHRIEPDAGVTLQRHDVVELTGDRAGVRRAAGELGRLEPPVHETDLAVYAGGIFLGLLLGQVRLDWIGPGLSLGAAGGLLVAGLVLGRARRIGPLRAYVPASARQLVRDLGILLFVTETGVAAGAHVVEAFTAGLWSTLAAGVFTTVVPVAGAISIARAVLRLHPLDAWGGVAGGITSSAALLALRRASQSSGGSASYAAAYTVGSVIVTLAGHVVVFFLR